MIFYKYIKEVKSSAFVMPFHLKVSRYKGYILTLFEIIIQIENNLFLNTINILMEYRYNNYIIYQELL